MSQDPIPAITDETLRLLFEESDDLADELTDKCLLYLDNVVLQDARLSIMLRALETVLAAAIASATEDNATRMVLYEAAGNFIGMRVFGEKKQEE